LERRLSCISLRLFTVTAVFDSCDGRSEKRDSLAFVGRGMDGLTVASGHQKRPMEPIGCGGEGSSGGGGDVRARGQGGGEGGGSRARGERCRVCSFTMPATPMSGEGELPLNVETGGAHSLEDGHQLSAVQPIGDGDEGDGEGRAVRLWFEQIKERCRASGGVWNLPELTTEVRPIGHVAL